MSLSHRHTRLLRFCSLAGGLGLALGVSAAEAQNSTIFGPNVYVFDQTVAPATINAQLNKLNGEGQFSTNRYAVLFKPGSYGSSSGPVTAPVGFYESVAGLGETPGQVTITGGLTADQLIDGNMTQNFWRSQENLTEVPVGGLTNGVLDWGVSQGASLRRLVIQGGLELTNSGSIGSTNPCAESSGGFTADSSISGLTNACSQQQWYTRNSVLTGGFSSNVWNFVFSGDLPANVPAQSYPGGGGGDTNVTNLATTPVSREKPFLYLDANGNYNVFVPALRTNSSGTSWSGTTPGPGSSLPISSFFIATPSSTLAQINSALASGQSLILTPGIYQYSGSINVTQPNTVVLGMGYATLVPQSGTAALTVSDVDGVQVAGLLIDAGPVNSPVLLELGNPNGPNTTHTSNPTSVNDVFFRIGGATAGSATTSLQVDSGSVILDNIWAWRADHGNSGTVGWTVNTAAHGLVVNGSNVTALGLAVEHYQQNQVQWNGTGGETIFYQSELPYDPPSQSAWSSGTTNGYPSYAVGPAACTHTAYGLGIYSYFDQNVNIIEDNAITVPNSTGVIVEDAGTVWLNGSGQISNVINGTGGAASAANADALVPVTRYVGSSSCVALPAAPSNLQATYQAASGSNTNGSVALTWTASSTAGVTYTVYRATGSGASALLQSGVTGTSYSDSTIAASTTYTYSVVATNSAGNSTAATSQPVTTGVAAPAPPTNLTAIAVSSSQINLAWTASTTPGVYYEIFEKANSAPTISEANLVGTTSSTSYSAVNLQASTPYYFDVVAVGSTTSPPAQANATTLCASNCTTSTISINTGGGATSGFLADEDFLGGSTYSNSTPVIVSGVANAAPEAVYQDEREGTFTYTIPGFVQGSTHLVSLHFAELYFSAVGSRKFNVAINTVSVLTNFDIVQAAGAAHKAVVEQFTATANPKGQIVIAFTRGAVDQPAINALVIQ